MEKIITFTGRTQAAILADIHSAAADMRAAWVKGEDSSPHSYRMDRLYEELRAARCRDGARPVRTWGAFLDGRRNGHGA